MRKKKKDVLAYKEIEIQDLKKLNVFDSIDGNYNPLGFSITYTRVPGGLIRTIINVEGMNQVFIPLPASYFAV